MVSRGGLVKVAPRGGDRGCVVLDEEEEEEEGGERMGEEYEEGG